MSGQIDLKGLNFGFQALVFGHLALEKSPGECGLFGHAGRGQQVHLLELVLAIVEIAQLDQAFSHQVVQAVIHLAVADAQLDGQVALGDVELVLQQPQDTKMQVFRVLRALAGHGGKRLAWMAGKPAALPQGQTAKGTLLQENFP